MKQFPRLFFCAVALFAWVSVSAAQTPYPSLSFGRESNDENTTDYVLKAEIGEIHKRVGGPDKPFRIVGVVARPSKRLAVMLFLNAQKEYQLATQTDKTVVITVDKADITNLTYELAAKSEDNHSKLEIGNILMALDDLRVVAKGSSVTMKLGALVHQLDSDNLAALRYLISEIEKDEKREKSPAGARIIEPLAITCGPALISR